MFYVEVEGIADYNPLKWIEYGVYGDLIIMYPKPYSIYIRETIHLAPLQLARHSTC